MGQRLKYKIRKFLKNPFYKRGDFYVKLTFTIFCISIFIFLFFLFDGIVYFENIIYAKNYVGNPFQVHVINVENGDAFLLRMPNNETIMVDTGDDKYYDRVESYIKQYFHYEKLNSIDYLILTHSDKDHIGNAISIMKKYNVKNIIRPDVYSKFEETNSLTDDKYIITESEIYSDVIKYAFDNKIQMVFANDLKSMSLGECKINFLWLENNKFTDDNNHSIVFKLIYKSKSFLFMGDAEEKFEENLISIYKDELNADVLKVGHHGSKTSTSQEFLNIVNPKFAILSCSSRSSILPSHEVIDRLSNMNIKIASTANEGNFAMTVTDSGIEFAKATRKPNYLALIFAIGTILVAIVWKNPVYNNTKAIKSIKGKKIIE